MNALTVCQPWASAIACGVKTIENRVWPAPGNAIGKPLLIHAGISKKFLHPVDLGFLKCFKEFPEEMPLGALLGRATLLACVPHIHAIRAYPKQIEFIEGSWCWVLRMDEVFEKPIPWAGAQRLWNINDLDLKAKYEAL